jgi:hypothetical protein
MARNPEALRITITISPDNKEIFEQVSQTAPYRRGRHLLRLATRGLLLEPSHLQEATERIQAQIRPKAEAVVSSEAASADVRAGASQKESAAVNPLDADLSDLWSSSMLKV